MTVSSLAPFIIAKTYDGYMDATTMAASLVETEMVMGPAHSVTIFADASAITGYDLSARLKAADWIFRMGERINAYHVLQRSKIVAMGVAVMNLTVGGKMFIHGEREAFLAALRVAGLA